MIIVSDTSPIANLIVINRLSLLLEVFSTIIIPDKVYAEVLSLEKFNVDLTEFKAARWITGKSITDFSTFHNLLKSVDSGEAEAITLANEVHAEYLLIDEKKGRAIAHQYGLKTVGLLGVLLKAKQQNHIPELKSILNLLRDKADFWISEDLYRHFLKLAGE